MIDGDFSEAEIIIWFNDKPKELRLPLSLWQIRTIFDSLGVHIQNNGDLGCYSDEALRARLLEKHTQEQANVSNKIYTLFCCPKCHQYTPMGAYCVNCGYERDPNELYPIPELNCCKCHDEIPLGKYCISCGVEQVNG